MLSKFYISFGQVHVHSIDGKTLDKDCLAELEAETKEEAHKVAMDIFNKTFHNVYTENELSSVIKYFPRGIIRVVDYQVELEDPEPELGNNAAPIRNYPEDDPREER